jgi:hypothetical protein
MDVTLDPRASRLLALMHEADTEAVTLDELEIAGVEDPARALHALELAGFTVERVTDRTASREEVECVRLAQAARAATAAAPPAVQAATAAAPPAVRSPAAPAVAAAAPALEQPTVEWPAPAELADPLPARSSPEPTPAPASPAAAAPPRTPRGSREAEAFASRAPRRTEQLIEAADRRPLLLALVALVLVALLGHAAAGRRS